jgi:hypothetical protein
LKRSKQLFFAVTFGCLLGFCGCAFSPLAKRSGTFGNAASKVVRDASGAYDTVQRATYDANVSSLVLDFDRSGFDRNKIKPFIPARDLQVRRQLLQGLQQYADDLADASSDHAFASVDEQSQALSKELTNLSSNADLKRIAPWANETEAKGLATAVDTLAKVLVERKRRKELPGIIAKMQPVLEQICRLIDEDIGEKPIQGQAGHGLRGQLWIEYDDLIGNQTDYLAKNKDKLAPSERKAEIAKLPELVQQQQDADAAMEATQTALRDLSNAHRALLAPTNDTTFKDRIQVLISDGQQIGTFYGKLQSKQGI